jgi:periplasmic protein TonB
MDRESKRTYLSRGGALLVVVLVHGLLILYALSIHLINSAASQRSIQVTLVDKPSRLPGDAKLSAVQINQLKPVLLPLSVPRVAVDIPAEPPPPQAVASEQTADSNASVIASNGVASMASNGSGTSGTVGGDIAVAHSVQPIYPDASVQANEQGYVVVGLLIDEHGRVRKVQVVESSGFRRLDQSVVDALRRWRFTRHADGLPPIPKWTQFAYGFHLASSDAFDLSTVSLILVPYDPAVAEQIRAAAVPIGAHHPQPNGADALRRLISTIQTAAPAVGRDFRGPLPPVQLVIKLGAVHSIQFLGIESHGFEVNEGTRTVASNHRDSRESQWELYKVTQEGGVSEWLIDVTRKGVIRNAEAMTCGPTHDAVIACP